MVCVPPVMRSPVRIQQFVVYARRAWIERFAFDDQADFGICRIGFIQFCADEDIADAQGRLVMTTRRPMDGCVSVLQLSSGAVSAAGFSLISSVLRPS